MKKAFNIGYFSLLGLCVIVCGCETHNPICSETYCLTGEIFERSELSDDQEFTVLPTRISEQDILNLWTPDVDIDFEPITVTGKLDWDFRSTEWQYRDRENGITYLKKVILEIEADAGRFGENRVILVHLNKDTVERDAQFIEHVDFLGTASIHLTHHIGIATFKGDIVGAPTK